MHQDAYAIVIKQSQTTKVNQLLDFLSSYTHWREPN